MTSASREIALLGGAPIKLFRFTRGAKSWLYSSTEGKAARDVVFMGDTYTAAAISHDRITVGGDTQQQSITITLPKTLAVTENWRPYPPGEAISVTVWTWHWQEGDFLVDWIGNLYAPVYDNTTLRLKSDSTAALSKTAGRQKVAQRGCDNTLFSTGRGRCNVSQAAHALSAVVSAWNSTTLILTATAFGSAPSGRLAGGWIEWTRADGIVEARDITAHSGSTVTIAYGALDLAAGMAVTAYPGCNGSWADCVYYGNTDNYGGELYKPGTSYFSGNLI